MNDRKRSISLSDLVLARLLSRGAKGETPGSIRSGLQPIAGRTRNKADLLEDVKGCVDRLQQEGLAGRVSARGSALALTPAGRERACAFLGLDRVPSRIPWATVRDTYLFARAVGIEPSYLKKRGLDGARAVVLARLLDLPWRPSSTLTSVLDGFLARSFELASAPRHSLRPALVARAAAAPEAEEAPGDLPAEAFDLETFAREVLSAAAGCRTGWFGDDKVFISHVWKAFAGRPGGRSMDLDAFKRRLVEVHRANLLKLSGANLVEAMDPQDVAASEARYLNATFHFIRCRRDE